MKSKHQWLLMVLIAGFCLVTLTCGIVAFLTWQPAKYAPKKTPPGSATALWQIYSASYDYLMHEGRPPISLDDIMGSAVLDSKGNRIALSRDGLEREIGTNLSQLVYLPDALTVDARKTPPDSIPLAYILDHEHRGFCTVIYRSRRTSRVALEIVKKQVADLNTDN